ncbi:MAG TPA: MGMT family protein [Chthonomonadaceae bacterium]|nr:MGMT family protein [Chthonomonadaceae bacterium]
MDEDLEIYAPLYAFIRTVPPGKVVTYGQAAGMTEGVALTARQVGAAMAVVPKDVPWHRVVGAGGMLPIGKRSPELRLLQRRLLEQEGATFLESDTDRVDMVRCQWLPEDTGSPQGSLFDET